MERVNELFLTLITKGIVIDTKAQKDSYFYAISGVFGLRRHTEGRKIAGFITGDGLNSENCWTDGMSGRYPATIWRVN